MSISLAEEVTPQVVLDLEAEDDNAATEYMSDLDRIDEYWERFDDETARATVKHYMDMNKARFIPYPLKERACILADLDLIKRISATTFYKHYIDWPEDGSGPFSEYEQVHGLTETDVVNITLGGNLDALKWLHDHKRFERLFSKMTMDYACAGGNMEVVEWLHENRKEGCSPLALVMAVEDVNFAMVEWLKNHRKKDAVVTNPTPLNKHNSYGQAMARAVEKKNLTMVEYLDKNELSGCPIRAMDAAFINRSMPIFIYFHRTGKECTKKVMDTAVDREEFDLVKWLNENRQEGCSINALVRAIEKGRIDLLVYLVEQVPDNGGPLSKNNLCMLVKEAAGRENTEMVEYLMHKHTHVRSFAEPNHTTGVK